MSEPCTSTTALSIVLGSGTTAHRRRLPTLAERIGDERALPKQEARRSLRADDLSRRDAAQHNERRTLHHE
jgi:hypothetical protein